MFKKKGFFQKTKKNKKISKKRLDKSKLWWYTNIAVGDEGNKNSGRRRDEH